MANFPRAPGFDRTLSFALAPYTFIGGTCDLLGSDFFETRLLLEPTICMRGPKAAAIFYDDELFERSNAENGWFRSALLGRGSVSGLDTAANRVRKTLLLSLLDSEGLARAKYLLAEEWISSLPWWEVQGRIVLYRELQTMLTRVACAWTGVPLPEVDVNRRTRDLVALFDRAHSRRPFEARLARRRVDAWLRQAVRVARADGGMEPRTALERLARSKLDVDDAALELTNLIRPIVALSVYIVLMAKALHEFPETVPRSEIERLPFIKEVRRFYPFFPAALARVRRDFEWRGVRFPAKRRTFLDIHGTNRHSGAWALPHEFRPQRFAESRLRQYAFVPRSGGYRKFHRCPGDELNLVLLDEALLQLTDCTRYRVAPQDLALDMMRVPALPRSRMILERVRADALGHPFVQQLGEESQVVHRKLA